MFRKGFRVTPQPPQPPAGDPVEATRFGARPIALSPPADFSGEEVGEVGPREDRPPRHGFSRDHPGPRGWSVGGRLVRRWRRAHPDSCEAPLRGEGTLPPENMYSSASPFSARLTVGERRVGRGAPRQLEFEGRLAGPRRSRCVRPPCLPSRRGPSLRRSGGCRDEPIRASRCTRRRGPHRFRLISSTRTRDAGNPDACNACLEGDDDDVPRVTAAVPREALVTIQETQED